MTGGPVDATTAPRPANTRATCALEAQGVSKVYGGLHALKDIDVRVRQGSRHALIGPNGAGKSTLFGVLSGVVQPTQGEVLFEGQNVTKWPVHKRIGAGMARTFQVTSLFPSLTVVENLVLAAQALTRTKFKPLGSPTGDAAVVERGRQAADWIALPDRMDVLAGSLSYGEQRQLEIGMAVVNNPTLLLMDEPAAGLSQAEVQTVVELLRDLPPSTTLVFIEHNMDVAFGIAEVVTVLDQGQKIAEGSPDEIRDDELVQDAYLGGEVSDA